MVKIQSHILSYFIELNKLSAYRLFAYVQTNCNNHLHKGDFEKIKNDLGISEKVILNNLRQLKKLGIVDFYSKNYFRFKSWRKFCPTQKNRIIDISLDNLKNLKKLRSIYYALHYRSANRMAKKIKNQARDREKSFGWFETSANFVKMVTGIKVTEQTLLRNLKHCETYDFVRVRRKSKILFKSFNLKEVFVYQANITQSTHIKRFKDKFYLLRFLPNKTSFRKCVF